MSIHLLCQAAAGVQTWQLLEHLNSHNLPIWNPIEIKADAIDRVLTKEHKDRLTTYSSVFAVAGMLEAILMEIFQFESLTQSNSASRQTIKATYFSVIYVL